MNLKEKPFAKSDILYEVQETKFQCQLDTQAYWQDSQIATLNILMLDVTQF